MSNQIENQELEILTEEQINKFPEKVKEEIVYLTENVRPKELAKLNPIISRLLNIKDRVEKLEFIPADEEGKFDVDNIKEYKSIKSEIGSFNGDLGRAGKALKKPYNDIKSAIVAIEKTFKSISDETKEQILTKFSDYEEEQKRIAKEKEERKNKALLDKISNAENAAAEAKKANEKSTVYNKIKYELITEKIVNNVNNLILNANEDVLNRTLSELENNMTFENLTKDVDFEILDVEVQAELKQYFIQSLNNSKTLLKNKLTSLLNEKELMISKAKSENDSVDDLNNAAKEIDSKIEKDDSLPDPPSAVEVFDPKTFNTLTAQEFYSFIFKERNKIVKILEARLTALPQEAYLTKLIEQFNNVKF